MVIILASVIMNIYSNRRQRRSCNSLWIFLIIWQCLKCVTSLSLSLAVSPAYLFFVSISLILFSVVKVQCSIYSSEGLFWKRCGRYVCYHYPHCHSPHAPLSVFKHIGNRDGQQPDRIVSRVHMPAQEISAPCLPSVYVIVCYGSRLLLKPNFIGFCSVLRIGGCG